MNLGASRGQIQAPRAFVFSRTVSHMLSGTYRIWKLGEIIYFDCTLNNVRAVLDNKAKVRVMGSKCQRLRANAASNIDNQGAFGEAPPGVPCQFNIKSADNL